MTRRMLVRMIAPSLVAAVVVAAPLSAAAAAKHFKANLDGYQEVPAVWSPAGGKFTSKLNKAGDAIEYELQYEDFANTVTQAHIHFAQKGVNGGIVVYLCSNLSSPTPRPARRDAPRAARR